MSTSPTTTTEPRNGGLGAAPRACQPARRAAGRWRRRHAHLPPRGAATAQRSRIRVQSVAPR
eukprot:8508180-Lingulodinium_polyedra.AAC.1